MRYLWLERMDNVLDRDLPEREIVARNQGLNRLLLEDGPAPPGLERLWEQRIDEPGATARHPVVARLYRVLVPAPGRLPNRMAALRAKPRGLR